MEPHPFRLIRNLGRTREIAAVLLNHGFGDVLVRVGWRGFWERWSRWVFRRRDTPPPDLTVYARVRLSLEALGPTFIKFGQVMSTRPDLIPADMIAELQKLQEQVPPFPSEDAVAALQRELGRPLDQLFVRFDRQPLAAGSLAQVHRAWHFDGTPLAIKIRRPNAVRDIERDLSLMQELALLAERHLPEARVFDPSGLVNHFARTVRREVNFSREGRTMQEFARLFSDDSSLYVPRVYGDLTTEGVLTMEFIDGLRVDDVSDPALWPCNPADIAVRGARLFMKQAFEYGVFHGDPHPGNLRIRPDGAICLLDYGMVGMLDDETREQLIDLFVAIARKDVDTAMEMVLAIGQPYREVDRPLLKIDMRDFVANYYGVQLERLNVGHMLSDFVSILGQHGIRCPGSLTLLIRALVTLEGIGRALDPGFNLAKHLQPYVERLVKDRYQPSQMADRVIKRSKRVWAAAEQLPGFVAKTLQKLSADELQIQLELRGLNHFTTEVERASNRLVVGIVMAALIVASALLIRAGANQWLTLPIYILSSLLGMWLIYGIFRSGRL
ncbi:MAG TPA: AarF/ABC1/UbiB kinase family protein [Planctomycetaceae bacterium]|nr:AarF/ABC1/UbiB kinase family protein [Planctomycetaceae bacterium]